MWRNYAYKESKGSLPEKIMVIKNWKEAYMERVC